MLKTGAIILAAGESSRMGQPKQLLSWKGEPLVLRAVRAARQAGADPVWVVTGAHARPVEAVLQAEPVRIIHNPHYQEGMGSSISCGFKAAQKEASLQAVFLLLCDQPAVDGMLLQNMKQTAAETGRELVASSYAGTVGPPLLVFRSFFPAFVATAPASGAKHVLRQNLSCLVQVPFAGGAADLDSPADLDGASPSD